MGKNGGKKKKASLGTAGEWHDAIVSQAIVEDDNTSPKEFDKDTEIFVSLAQELKEEGNRLFQRRDYEGALLKFERALKLLPWSHTDVSHLWTDMASCHMQLGISEYPKAIHECNLALEVEPCYTNALLERARCYEGLNRLDLALRDVSTVICIEPTNIIALEVGERIKDAIKKRGLKVNTDTSVIELPSSCVPPVIPSLTEKKSKKKNKKNKIEDMEVGERIVEHMVEEEKRVEDKIEDKVKKRKKRGKGKKGKENKSEDKTEEVNKSENKTKEVNKSEEKRAEDKTVVKEKISSLNEHVPTKVVKLIFEEDIRLFPLPLDCTFLQLREIIKERFPSSSAFLVKYRDQEGDLVTITTNEELKWVEELPESRGSPVRLHIVEVSPEKDPLFKRLDVKTQDSTAAESMDISNKKGTENATCIDNWIIEFAQLFKNYIGLDADAYLDLHEIGMKLFSEAMEEVITSEEAQDLFDQSADKFQEMAALALFNWGNVHMCRARKKVYFTEDSSKDNVIDQISTTYDWALKEYSEAGMRYEEAMKIKPNFYEGLLALGQQQFEQAKLSWYYAIGTNADLDAWPSTDILELYNSAEENMDKGVQMLEESEEESHAEMSEPSKTKVCLHKMGLEKLFTDIPTDEAAEKAESMRAQINILWGTMLYERSIVEYKLGLPVWHECLEVAIEKFELAGASPTDTAVMIKNHCSNNNAVQGLSFKIDEIVQAWNEMYEAKRWSSRVQSLRLEPLLRRRVSKLLIAFDDA